VVFLHEECILWAKYKDGEEKMDVMVQAKPIYICVSDKK
jgi:hypothetical protein